MNSSELVGLADEFGSPLYVYDAKKLSHNIHD
jgi:diaminopimelate decarboxylase